MTREDAINALKMAEKISNHDREHGHIDADDILRGFLLELGYTDVVAAYDRVSKWYA